ncbi:MAG: 2-hydroxyacid dehydrogenase [Devosia sp.]|uniref:hydroxyacid dehydrogenase n=1 Tax=Devosia sp. TaxID=1871048 RepID=UPI00260CC750|nr:hydroxyacid dehydrogenase [Devosia sp.]MDB5542608.1 2-hydroxyacid dehydrogenase [Devosia sp.]
MGGRSGGKRPALAFAYDPIYTERVFTPEQLSRLAGFCAVLSYDPILRIDTPVARKLLREAEILVTGWGPPMLDEALLAAAPNLRLIAHSAGSVKYFIAPEVFEAGITVTNAVAANAVPVAEYTLAAILFANKQVLRFRDLYRERRSELRADPIMAEPLGNFGKVVGIIGASRIGLRVIELLRPFDFEVLLYDPYASEAQARAMGATLVGLDELMARADVASLHAPAIPATRQMIDARRLALLRDGATFINTARGSVVDHAALERELVSGRISAVIDVTEPEVLPAASPLYELPNVLLTPHMAGAIGAERERLGTLCVDEVERFVTGQPLQHAVAYDMLERLA